MSLLGKSRVGFGIRKRTQIGLKMGSFPAKLGSFWTFSKPWANTPTERRGYTAGGSAGDPVHGTSAGIIHVNLKGFAGRLRCYEAEAGKDD